MTKLEEMMQTLEGNFWTRLNELVDDVKSAGFDVCEYNREGLAVYFWDDDEEVEAYIRLAGTENTIVIDSYEEVYRG